MLMHNKHKYEYMNSKIINVRCQSLRIINILHLSFSRPRPCISCILIVMVIALSHQQSSFQYLMGAEQAGQRPDHGAQPPPPPAKCLHRDLAKPSHTARGSGRLERRQESVLVDVRRVTAAQPALGLLGTHRAGPCAAPGER